MTIAAVSVLGTGAWGTTFAQVLAHAGRTVTMWGRNPQTVEQINSGSNARYLPGIRLAETIRATTDPQLAIDGADLVVVALPTQTIRSTLPQFRALATCPVPILSLAKGLEDGTNKLVTDVITESLGVDIEQVAALSGPNLAREIIECQPTATVIAAENESVGAAIAEACHNEYFRPYLTTDLIGCEIAGATKNVIAVAVGASEGLGWGANTRTTLITRGLAEMTRYGIARGARAETFAGLAGMGDLIATCSSKLSRNYSFGYRIGQGKTVEQAYALSTGVVEGAKTAMPLTQHARSLCVDVPIAEAVADVLSGEETIATMGKRLLGRPRKKDGWAIELI
ncbi:MAG: NAD(P)H-dependent glycerol-3-phosphate dehydrogenase [Actinomycetaceae bacterium]|nr:NAD(P)H-dependent glycerol-3-phosphate dehydrogenase [Actinomycetaceae bacterium]